MDDERKKSFDILFNLRASERMNSGASAQAWGTQNKLHRRIFACVYLRRNTALWRWCMPCCQKQGKRQMQCWLRVVQLQEWAISSLCWEWPSLRKTLRNCKTGLARSHPYHWTHLQREIIFPRKFSIHLPPLYAVLRISALVLLRFLLRWHSQNLRKSTCIITDRMLTFNTPQSPTPSALLPPTQPNTAVNAERPGKPGHEYSDPVKQGREKQQIPPPNEKNSANQRTTTENWFEQFYWPLVKMIRDPFQLG